MNFPKLKIDEEKCVHCGLCTKDCIANCLELGEDNQIPKFKNGKEYTCIKCQHCLAVCPTGALSIWGKNPDKSEQIADINSDEILKLIKSRRSVRQYKPSNLDKDRMDKLKNVLKYAPTGVNFHKLHFSFVDDIEVMDDIRNLTNEKAIIFLKNPVVKQILPHFAGMAEAIESGHDVIYRGAPHMVVVSVPLNAHCKKEDPLIALSYFDLYAQSMGVGTLWCGFAYYCFKIFPELSDYVNIPDGYKVAYVMLFGIPDVKYKRCIQPEEYNITCVSGDRLGNLSITQKLKRWLWNILG